MSDDEQDVDSIANTAEALEADPTAVRPQLAVPKLLEGSEVPAFLELYSYAASTAMNWCSRPPELSITVVKHYEAFSHTWYNVECSLAAFKEPFAWQSGLRLKHIRKGVYDVVKRQLGSSYQTYFSRVPFAQRGGPSGTTARLDAWFRRLAYCINSQLVSPIVAAAVLRLTRVPPAPVPVPAVVSQSSQEAVLASGQMNSSPCRDVLDLLAKLGHSREDTTTASCSSRTSPRDEQRTASGYCPAQYTVVELPQVKVSAPSIPRTSRFEDGACATDDVSATVLGAHDDDDTELLDSEGGDVVTIPIAACLDGGEWLSRAERASAEAAEGTSTCTGGGRSDSDSSGSSAEDTDRDGAARIGKALRQVPHGEIDPDVRCEGRSRMQKRLSARRKLVDAQAI